MTARRLLALLALAVLAPAAPAAADYGTTIRATPGLVGYWPLDESVAPIADVLGPVTATPAAGFTLGRPAGIDFGGTSMTLSGTASANFGNQAAYRLAGDLSIEAWVAPTMTSGDRYVLSRGTSSAGYHLFLASGRIPALQVNGTRLTAPSALGASGWHQIVGTLTGHATALYVDGRLVASGTVSAAPGANTQSLWLGRLSRSASGYFQGGLDEIALYAQGLDAATVAAHFAAGADLSPPAAVFTATPGPVSAAPDGTIAFTGSKGGLTFTCALDDGAAVPCPGSFAYDLLRDGGHTLAVTATDRWGTTAQSTYAWQVALPAAELADPVTTLSATPAALTNATSATFAFAGSKTRLAFACRLDGGAWTPCASGAGFTGLKDGDHVFEVRATDRWGVVEDPPRAFRWTVDLTPPETFVLARKAGATDAGTAVLGSESGARFECRSAQGQWAACDPAFAQPSLTAAGQLLVRAIDAAGNPDPSPATVVLDPPPTNAPITFGGATASFAIGGNRSVSDLRCSLDGAAPAACPWPLVFDDLPYGAHRLTITDPNLPSVVFPTIGWTDPLPLPRIVGSQFPALLQLGSRRHQATLAVARLPRLLFQSNTAGTARITLTRGRRRIARWSARVTQGSNLVRLPRAAWRRLRPGRYAIGVVARNATGASAPFSLRFDALRSTDR